MSIHHPRPDHDVAADHRVELLLAAAGAPAEAGRQPGEAAAVAAFRQKVGHAAAPEPSRAAWRAGVVAALSSLLLVGGGVTAAAVSGSLPAPAQDTARTWLEQVGVEVPGGSGGTTVPVDASEDEPADDHETSTDGDAAKPADGPSGRHEPDRHDAAAKGEEVSRTARDPELTGRDKGVAVSELASDGRSRAGQHGGGSHEDAPHVPAVRGPAVDLPGAQGTQQRSQRAAAARKAHPRNN
jgi:hypothetical protein